MLEIKKFPVEMPFLGGGGFLHTPFYIHTLDRLDKSHSALAEARLKIKVAQNDLKHILVLEFLKSDFFCKFNDFGNCLQ